MTKKPTLLLCPGTGYSATSPLYFTLASDHQYCHGGYDKEYKFLPLMYFNEVKSDNFEYYHDIHFRRMFDPKIKDGNIKLKGGLRTRPPKVFYTNHYVNFTEEQKNNFYSSPYTVDKYIDYYLLHYNNVKEHYQAVSDFSTDNANLPLWFLKKITPKLKEHFDVKIILIFRDPIRRLFSEVNKCYYSNDFEFFSAKELFFEILHHPQHTFYGIHSQYENPNILTYYKDIIDHYTQCFDQVHIVTMEDLWTSQEEIERLSDFLSYKITKMHQNVYWPPMGSKAPKYEYLADQWMSDKEDLSQKTIDKSKQLMSIVYDDWKSKIGSISNHWL
jgi:hypothetical protein